MPRAIVLDPRDNVATVLEPTRPADVVRVTGARTDEVVAAEEIPFGFKIALQSIPAGELVIKYGETIGRATLDIPRGALAHIHNVVGTRGRGDLAAEGASSATKEVAR